MKTQLVYADIMNCFTAVILDDTLVQIFSDNGVFLVTTEKNIGQYPLELYPVDAEVIEAYDFRIDLLN